MKITPVNMITSYEFSELVSETYGRPYEFQQQDGCRDRGFERFRVPPEYVEDFEATEIPEDINGPEMGVSFQAWLTRDPETPVGGNEARYQLISLFWERNFYPHITMVINDLHARGLLPAGEYIMVIDW
jgi:hypothetical protein